MASSLRYNAAMDEDRRVGWGNGLAPEAGGGKTRPILFISLLLLCTVVAFFARGYSFGKADQNLYLPFVYHWMDPSLFKGDSLLTLGYARESVVWWLLALVGRALPVPWLALALYLAASFTILALVFKVANGWWKSAAAGWIAVLLWMPSYTTPGVTCLTFDNYLTTRCLGAAFAIWALYEHFRHRDLRCSWAVFLGGLVHIITILPMAGAIGFAHIVNRRWRSFSILAAGVAGSGLLLFAVSKAVGVHHVLFFRYSGNQLAVASHMASELFPQRWTSSEWTGIALTFFSILLLLRWGWGAGEVPGVRREVWSMTAALSMSEVLGIAGSLAGLSLFVQLCLPRGLALVQLLTILLLAGPIARSVERGGGWSALGFSGLFLWVSGEPFLQIMACLVAVGTLRTDALAQGCAKLKGQRRNILALSMIVLAGVAAWQFAWYWWGWTLDAWLPSWAAVAASLLPAAALALLPLRKGRRMHRLLPLFLCIGWCASLLIAPPEPVVGYLRHWKSIRRLYGPSIATKVVHSAAEARRLDEERAMAALVREKVPKEATVIIPPDWMRFRIQAFRMPFVTYKDGVPSEFDAAYSARWYQRIQEIRGVRVEGESWRRDASLPLSREELLALAQRYRDIRLDFVVTRRAYDLPLLGRSGPYALYELREAVP